MLNNPIEQQLIAELKRAEGPYRRALAMIQASLPHGDGTSEEIAVCLTRLEPFMLQTQKIENELAPLRKRWLDLSQRPSAELQQVLNLHEQLLSTLIGKINNLEQSMQKHRQAAIPGVDSFVKHQQMQRAYQHLSR